MPETKDSGPIDLVIVRIADLGFEVNESVIPLETYGIGYSLVWSFNSNENWVEFILKAEYRSLDTEPIFMMANVLTRFFIKDLQNFILMKEEKETLDLPNHVMVTMFSITFTHTRAIMSKNCASSKFKDYYLPLINPAESLQQLLKLK